MAFNTFHPWGQLDWVLSRLDIEKWDLLGCLSFEDRCLSTPEFLVQNQLLGENCLIKILDPPSEYTDAVELKLEQVEEEYTNLIGLDKVNVPECNLLATTTQIVSIASAFFSNTKENIILDVTCLPKRFFFPFVKMAMQSATVKNLVITYGKPLQYSPGDLSQDPEPWDHLPLFGLVEHPEPTPKHAMVGVGFIPFGISKLLKDKYSNIPVSFFFPFPPGPPSNQRSWEFLRTIEQTYNLKNQDQIIRVDAVDVSDVFNHIKSITGNNAEPSIFAPYGPKPISVAMAIYSSLSNSPVYYTQPKKYNPDYSSGKGEILSYLIKQNGKLLYEL